MHRSSRAASRHVRPPIPSRGRRPQHARSGFDGPHHERGAPQRPARALAAAGDGRSRHWRRGAPSSRSLATAPLNFGRAASSSLSSSLSKLTPFGRGGSADGGALSTKLRQMVSLEKKRFQDNGFDLDLTYITPSIIAMGFPSAGVEGVYRNNMDQVARFFDCYHPAGMFRCYNLCEERVYDPAQLGARAPRLRGTSLLTTTTRRASPCLA